MQGFGNKLEVVSRDGSSIHVDMVLLACASLWVARYRVVFLNWCSQVLIVTPRYHKVLLKVLPGTISGTFRYNKGMPGYN